MRTLRYAATAILLGLSAPAAACMAEPLPEAVLFDRPPTSAPAGYTLLKVVGSIRPGDWERPLLVRIVEPAAARRLGRLAWLRPEPFTSCTASGRIGSEAYVMARPAGRLQGRTLLIGRTYRRSRWDFFWNWFGRETYRAPHQPSPIYERTPLP